MNEKIVLSVNETLCSEYSEDLSSINAKYLICDFLPNANNTMLNRKTITNWLSTLINQPVVAKISLSDSAKGDFTSHNMNPVVREDESGAAYQDYEFNTEACGVFTDVAIETINGKECITANARLWKRFPNFIAVVKSRLNENIPIKTSWEIAIKKSHYEMINGKKIKCIDDGQFLGHCMLSRVVPPAYKDSQLLEVANNETEIETDIEMVEALSKDLSNEVSSNKNITEQKEDESLTDVEKIENSEIDAKTEIDTDKDTKIDNKEEVAALTEYDLRQAIRQAIADKLNKDKWEFYIVYHFPSDGIVWIQDWEAASELDVVMFTYTVENDVVTVSEPTNGKLTVSISQINSTIEELNKQISQKNDALVEASTKINELSTELSNLKPFKEAFEKAEQEKLEKELSEKRESLKLKAIKSKFITDEEINTSTEIKQLIENVDEKAIRDIIAERFMKSLDDKKIEASESKVDNKLDNKELEVSQVKTNINDGGEDENIDPKTVMKNYLKNNRRK